MVAESNPRQELADILSSAYLFIFSAVGFCREYGVKPHFAHITEDQVCFSAAGYTMMRALDTSLTPEWAQSQLTALEKHLRKTAEKRLDDTRREIERLQGELKKMEGRV